MGGGGSQQQFDAIRDNFSIGYGNPVSIGYGNPVSISYGNPMFR